ncbi:MAG: EAL domain-containing protein, partial [Actinobacteria bacterium]|nr:EAL domain-containing protein [Actinomycetota bacterium]
MIERLIRARLGVENDLRSGWNVPRTRRLGLLEVTVTAALAVHCLIVATAATHAGAYRAVAAVLGVLALAGYLGWRTATSVVVRATTTVVLGAALMALHDGGSDYVLLWYFVVVAVYPIVLPRVIARALIVLVPLAYLATVPLGPHGPIGVELLRGVSLLLVGMFVHGAAGALRQVVDEHDRVAALLDACLGAAPVAFVIVDRSARLQFWNAGLDQLRRRGTPVRLGQLLDELHLADGLAEAVATTLETGQAQDRIPMQNDGRQWVASVFPVAVAQRTVGVAAMAVDMTERSRQEDRLRHIASHDSLTGLPNRSLFADRLGSALAAGESVSVLFCDVDNFKVLNDALGHQAGDLTLIALAERLRVLVGSDDDVARLGGDEFGVVLRSGSLAHAQAFAERVCDAMHEPFQVEGRPVTATLSVGVAQSDGSEAPAGLLRDADVALYQAKGNGRDQVAVFDDSVRSAVEERMSLGEALRRAVELDQVRVVYQPVVRLTADGGTRLDGFEALARWSLPERGPVAPEAFIKIAEDLGLIQQLGAHVLQTACEQMRAWRDEYDPTLRIAVNVSARQLDHPDLARLVSTTLARACLPPGALELEITESVLMRDVAQTSAVLVRLRAIGVHIALDDFGTGYSSLAYLRELPIDTIKIDRS